MTGYILKTDNEECKDNINITEDRSIFKDIDTGKHFIYCNECTDGACMVEVDASYAIKASVSKSFRQKG